MRRVLEKDKAYWKEKAATAQETERLAKKRADEADAKKKEKGSGSEPSGLFIPGELVAKDGSIVRGDDPEFPTRENIKVFKIK